MDGRSSPVALPFPPFPLNEDYAMEAENRFHSEVIEARATRHRPRRRLNLPAIVTEAPAMLYLLGIRSSLPVADS
jgi:hypothetical protein